LALDAWLRLVYHVARASSAQTRGAGAGGRMTTTPDLIAQLVVFGLNNGAAIALAAMGITLVFSVVRILNLAYGDVFALATVMAAVIIVELDIRPDSPPALFLGGLALSALGAMAVAVGLNLLLERFAFRPFRGTSRLAPLIATMGLSFVLYQVSLLWRQILPSWVAGDHRSVPGLPEVPLDSTPDLIPARNLFERLGMLDAPVVIEEKGIAMWVVAIVIGLLVAVLLKLTRFGVELRAVAEQPDVAQMFGVDVNRTIARTFALSGLLAGIAAFAFVMNYARPYGQHGVQSGLIAFSAAILGGIGNPVGAVVSGFLFGVAQTFSDFFLAQTWTPAIVYGLLILLLFVRPSGFGAADDADSWQGTRDAVTVLYRGSRHRWMRWVWLGVFLYAALYPLTEPLFGLSRQSTLTVVFIYVILALGLTIMLGYAGLLDLGYAISFGIGGYVAALLTDPYGRLRGALGITGTVDFTLVLLAAVGMAALFGVLNAVLTFRMRADYLAVVTLAYGLIIRQIVIIFPEYTNGSQGISAVPPPSVFGIALASPTARYYLALLLLAVCAIAAQRLIQSRAGRAFIAMGEDEMAAAASGVNVNHYKGLAFVLGTAMAGLAGALYASSISLVEPEMGEFRVSMMVLAMVIVSGAGSVPGAIVGAVVISLYDRLAIPTLGDFLANTLGGLYDIRQFSYLIFGLAIYLTVLIRTSHARRVLDDLR
jgi:branched-chain amino acid transport system permease protein